MRLISGFVATLIAIGVLGQTIGQTKSELATGATGSQSAEGYPERPIKVVVPFGAGGGSDTFVRILQQAIEQNDFLSQPVVVINVPGAGGAIGSRQVLNSEPDGSTLMCLHDGIITSKYAGNTDYGPEAFEPIAGTGEVGTVIAVAEDSPYADLGQLLDAAADRPNQVVFSANIGAPSHFAGLMLEHAKPAARFRYTQTGGGAKRFAALAGGHIDVSSFSLAEYVQFKSAGLRGLAYCGETRHSAAPELPTATEQGLDVINSIMQFWWAPKNTPVERIEVFSAVLERAMQTDEVRNRLDAIHTAPVFLTGDAFRRSLAEREKRYAGVAQRELTALPNFPKWALGAVILLSMIVAGQEFVRRRSIPANTEQESPICFEYLQRPEFGIAAVGLTALYIVVMQSGWASFRLATIVYILAVGLMLTRYDAKRALMLGAIAIVMGFGLHHVFTNVFAIALP